MFFSCTVVSTLTAQGRRDGFSQPQGQLLGLDAATPLAGRRRV